MKAVRQDCASQWLESSNPNTVQLSAFKGDQLASQVLVHLANLPQQQHQATGVEQSMQQGTGEREREEERREEDVCMYVYL